MTLTVLSWLWSQPDRDIEYTAEHVNIWAASISRHLTLPHRFACVTDTPEGIDPRVEIIAPLHEFEDIKIPGWGAQYPHCLRRLSLFRPDAAEIFGPRFVSMDIDVVISGSLDPLFDRDDEFVIYQSFPHPFRLYSGGMFLMTAGARPQVYEQFSLEGIVVARKRYIGSDQAWISAVLGPGEATWGMADGVRWWPQEPDADTRIMFFHGRPKPDELLDESAWVAEHYRIGGE